MEVLKRNKTLTLIVALMIGAMVIAGILIVVLQDRTPASYIDSLRQSSSAPDSEIKMLEQCLCSFLTPESGKCPEDAVMRDGSYREYSDSGAANAVFLADIESIQQTYKIYFSWPVRGGESFPDSISIECPLASETKYPDSKCIDPYEQ